MKKRVIAGLSLVVFLLGGCQKTTEEAETRKMEVETTKEKGENPFMEVEVTTGIYSDKDWSEEFGTYKGDVIPDKETAINVAIQILNGMDRKSKEELIPSNRIYYDPEDEFWVVPFVRDFTKEDQFTLGGGCCIAIQKKDGKVLRIWFEE